MNAVRKERLFRLSFTVGSCKIPLIKNIAVEKLTCYNDYHIRGKITEC